MRVSTIALSFIVATLVSSCSPEEEKAGSEAPKEIETDEAEIANEAIKKQEEYKEKALEESKAMQEERKLIEEGAAHSSSGMRRR